MNLSPDIIFRLIFSAILTIVVVKMLWSIVKNYLERNQTKAGSSVDMDALIEQQKRALSLTTNAADDEARAFIAALQWGESNCFESVVEAFKNELQVTLSADHIKKAAHPLNRQLAKGREARTYTKKQLLNIIAITALYLPHDILNFNTPEGRSPFEVGEENRDLSLAEYLALLDPQKSV